MNAAAREEPLYFPAENPRLFGWLHAATGNSSDRGVVICKPFGYEAICGHRSLAAFARMTAAAGLHTLRFDYLGTGDSAEIDDRADQIEAWCEDVLVAIDELRRRTGVERVCLLGFRLGALLATLAASRSPVVDSLILVAPVVSGRRCLSEMRTMRLAAFSTRYSTPTASSATLAGSIEVAGHCVSAATISVLSQIDLANQAAPSVSRVLMVDRNDLPAARAWANSLSQAGVATEYSALPGFVQMMMRTPHEARIPHEMIVLARQWLLRFPARASSSGGREPPPRSDRSAASPETTSLSLPGCDPTSQGRLTERPIQFGAEGLLFGIVTEPDAGEIRRRAVILLNAGADCHVGIGRAYVALARRWARAGYVVLRMDLAGLGDSGTRQGRPDDEVYPPEALYDIRAAVELMHTRYRVREVTLAGLCSGAYHALQAAAAAIPVNRILMVNPETFLRLPESASDDIPLAHVISGPGFYRERLISPGGWKQLLTGKVRAWRVVRVCAHRVALPVMSMARNVLRAFNIRLPNDLSWVLEQVSARGVQITMVFARGEPGWEVLRFQAGSALERLGERLHIHVIDCADHTFSKGESRALLEKVLSDELYLPPVSRNNAMLNL